MIDVEFLAGLRALAATAAEALGGRASLARDYGSYQAAEVADVAANAFGALGAERARLADAVRRAEATAGEADNDFGTWDRAAATAHDHHFLTPDDRARIVARMQAAEGAAEEAHRALAAAQAALGAFDTAVRDGGAG